MSILNVKPGGAYMLKVVCKLQIAARQVVSLKWTTFASLSLVSCDRN